MRVVDPVGPGLTGAGGLSAEPTGLPETLGGASD